LKLDGSTDKNIEAVIPLIRFAKRPFTASSTQSFPKMG